MKKLIWYKNQDIRRLQDDFCFTCKEIQLPRKKCIYSKIVLWWPFILRPPELSGLGVNDMCHTFPKAHQSLSGGAVCERHMQSQLTMDGRRSKWKRMVAHGHEDFIYLRFPVSLFLTVPVSSFISCLFNVLVFLLLNHFDWWQIKLWKWVFL